MPIIPNVPLDTIDEETGTSYWYFYSTTECPVCGREETTRERRYGKRPEDYWKRHEVTHYYDYCNE